MLSFKDIFKNHSWESAKLAIYSKNEAAVRSALEAERPGLEDFMALISPAAAPFLEEMAVRSQALTVKRFGRTLQMYAPLYLSNECQNICTYCAFSLDNPIKRKTLSDDEIIAEAKVLKKWGYDHVLLVTGESARVGPEYLRNAIRILQPYFAHISIEVQPLDTIDYKEFASAGLSAVLVYQETYREETYKSYHPKGRKSSFYHRLETPDRIGEAGIHKIGLGILIGLEDWRTDSFFNALHLDYLEKKYWKTRYSVSFPRLRPIDTDKDGIRGTRSFDAFMSDRELVQLICAYRIFRPETELSLSTRETESFRNNVIRLGITSLSAGSKTNPGGYAAGTESLGQFEISDERSPKEIAELITGSGYEVVWKDWDPALSPSEKA